MIFSKELYLLLKARYPIIYISSLEEERLEYTIHRSINLHQNKPIYSWDFINGYKTKINNSKFAARNPLQALELIENLNAETPSIFILKDFNKFLADTSVLRKIKNLLNILKNQSKSIIIISTEIQIPKDLTENITVIDFLLPTEQEIKLELIRLSKSIESLFNLEFLELLTQSCQGLTLEKIRLILSKSIARYGSINKNSINLILHEKKQILNQTQILQFCDTPLQFADIGGLENLKNWLNNRKNSFSKKAKIYGLPSPRGVLLIGIQGTGKSLTAKAIASEWKLPLLKLDVGRLFAGIVGESENRIREMIKLSEALAPCVLWIDEIDKAFSEQSKNFDSGTTNRLLGTFITWLSEKESKVFIVATANNFFVLPLELVRKGRFDEIFFIDLPNLLERKKIFEVILKRLRLIGYNSYDINQFSEKSKGFSGAEIEQAIIEGMHIAFNEKREFNTTDILGGLNSIIPLSQINSQRIRQIQNLALSGQIRLAS
jgi:SpoVK/Ycf46/Vps4 family AAA+-type ATPase